MIYLVLSIFSSCAIGTVMRFSQSRISAKITMLATNYFVCILLSGLYTGFGNIMTTGADGYYPMLGMGLFNGSFYMISLVLSQYNIRRNGMVLPSIYSRLGGLLIPMALSICFFGEKPGLFQIIGSIISVACIIIMNYDKDAASPTSLMPLLLLFFTDGIAGIMSKVYTVFGSPQLSNHFLFYTFLSAFLLSFLVALARKEKPGYREILFGIMIGVPNFFSAKLLLKALNEIPVVIAYPIRNVGCILVLALISLIAFKEKLKKRQWYSIAAILFAVILLTL